MEGGPMTEAEWSAGTDSGPMLRFLRDSNKASDRKRLLFGCSCCRLLLRWLPFLTMSMDELEKLEDDLNATKAETRQGEHARFLVSSYVEPFEGPAATNHLLRYKVTQRVPLKTGFAICREVPLSEMLSPATFIPLFRDVFGNPFRPVSLDPRWRTSTVVSLAQAAYDERILHAGHLDPARLAVLSDALEEAGCTDEATLSHLRSPGPHVRACWVVDLLLGKS
jgi:hypothetical protein